ncbi:hypothetical protein RND81_12G084500 [Saponaria officinalis]|uniref:Myb-like domain-containing protein n=1 Tax=Saponaria officinalis TaxID=3572 RepID=A0AAW1H853_SAPOF
MAASANPSNNQEQQQQQQQSFFNGGSVNGNSNNNNNNNSCNGNGGNSGTNYENSGVLAGIKHNPGISTDWTAEEQAILDDGLVKYASEINVVRYAKIALSMPNKTVRDIALRCRWLNKKEVSKRRKEDHSRKSKDKREKVTENTSKPPHLASRPSSHPYAVPAVPDDNEDGVSYEAIGGPTGELLKQNQQLFQQISANFSSFQVQDNISLFCQARDNLAKIMNSMSDTPEIMKQMPPLPVKLNEELANTILPRTSH